MKFVYDGYKLIEELNALNANASLRRYTWQPEELGMDVPLTVTEGGAMYYYHTDANKNITELTDAEGAVVAHYEYSPFGQQTAATGVYAATNPFRFSSEYFDEETQLVYYNYRDYSPDMGRWLSRDPIGEEGGYNLYRMVSNNTINRFDFLGLGLRDVLCWIFSLFGDEVGRKAKIANEIVKLGEVATEKNTPDAALTAIEYLTPFQPDPVNAAQNMRDVILPALGGNSDVVNEKNKKKKEDKAAAERKLIEDLENM